MPTTISLSEMETFVAVVRHGSFTHAAQALATDKARVSRTVTRLEERLKAKLLLRSTRRLRLTEVGREVFERSTAILIAAAEIETTVSNHRGAPAGVLTLTAGPEFGTLRVDTWTAEYLRRHPAVRVESEYTNRIVDLIHEGFDVAVRVGSLPDSGLSARRLGEVRYGLYASPAYLDGSEPPTRPEDLTNHHLIMFAPRGRPHWLLVHGKQEATIDATPRYSVNNNLSALAVAASGAGIALLPSYMARTAILQGALRLILPGWSRPPVPVHAVFASSRFIDPKVRAFVDLAVERFED